MARTSELVLGLEFFCSCSPGSTSKHLGFARVHGPASKYSKWRCGLNFFSHDVYYWESASFADRLLMFGWSLYNFGSS
jgi:hypothetical protein